MEKKLTLEEFTEELIEWVQSFDMTTGHVRPTRFSKESHTFDEWMAALRNFMVSY